jgi:hypothetical protein
MLFQPKTATKLIGSFTTMRELTCPQGVELKVAGTNVIDFMLESVGTPRSQALSQLVMQWILRACSASRH